LELLCNADGRDSLEIIPPGGLAREYTTSNYSDHTASQCVTGKLRAKARLI